VGFFFFFHILLLAKIDDFFSMLLKLINREKGKIKKQSGKICRTEFFNKVLFDFIF